MAEDIQFGICGGQSGTAAQLLLSLVSNVPSMMFTDFSLIGKGKGTP
jgi:hypothetical protein